MIESIGAQHVWRRRRPSSSGNAYKPLDTIKQKPAHKKRAYRQKKHVPLFKGFSGFGGKTLRSRFSSWVGSLRRLSKSVLKSPPPPASSAKKEEGRAAPVSPPVFRSRLLFAPTFLHLMSPAFIIAAIGVFALLLYCSLVQLRERSSAFITPWEDSRFQANMASYAGLSPQASGPAPGEGEASPDSVDIPLDLMETFSWLNYTVKKGDSVSKLAVNYGISMDAIIASNGITNVKRLYEGQVIKVPNMDGIPYTVKKGDSLLKISTAMNIPLAAILDANDIQSETITPGTLLFIPGAKMRTEDLKLALGEFFIYPIRGRLTSPFGWRKDPISGVRRYHAALDLAAPIGTPIKAAMDGRVSTVGFNGTYGNFIIISHSDGFQTMYAHLSVTSVKQGSAVTQGTKIGEVGNTGYSTGPHLHWAVFKNGRAIDPRELVSH
ncbi:MAG: M23 family metallopeptidase [Treponema sp.]|nr:M23 family metallopeptidase [Treponema sp.]